MRKTGEYAGGPLAYAIDIECRQGDEAVWRYVDEGHAAGVKIVGDRQEWVDDIPRHRRSGGEGVYLVPTLREDRILVVKQIFSWFASEAISEYEIAKRLNERGVPALKGEEWSGPGILYVLKNPVYIGSRNASGRSRNKKSRHEERAKPDDHLGGVRDAQPSPSFEPIIDPVMFAEVQERLASRKKREKTAPRSEESWLSGLMVCARCGERMWGEPTSEGKLGTPNFRAVPAYRCSTYRRHKGKCSTECRAYTVKHSLVERELEKFLESQGLRISRLLDSRRDNPVSGILQEWGEKNNQRVLNDHDMTAFISIYGEDESNSLGVRVRRYYRKEQNSNEFLCDLEYEVEDQDGSTGVYGLKDCYAVVYNLRRVEFEEKLSEQRIEHARLANLFERLDPNNPEDETLIGRMIANMRSISSEIKHLEAELISLVQGDMTIGIELEAIRDRLLEARGALGRGTPRQKAAAVGRVITEIRCQFRHTAKSSKIQRLEFVTTTGEAYPRDVG